MCSIISIFISSKRESNIKEIPRLNQIVLQFLSVFSDSNIQHDQLKKLKAHKSTKGPGARDTSFDAKALVFRTRGAVAVKNI